MKKQQEELIDDAIDLSISLGKQQMKEQVLDVIDIYINANNSLVLEEIDPTVKTGLIFKINGFRSLKKIIQEL